MTVPYATPRDVYDLGLTARAFVTRPSVLDAKAGDFLDPSTGTFSIVGHGLADDDLVRLVLVAAGGALPGGASATSVYSPLPLDFWRFRLATSPNGAAITFTNAGTVSSNGASAWGIQIDPERRIARTILAVSADIDQDLTAHAAPIEPDPTTGRYPEKLVGIVARVTARRLLAGLQFENAAFRVAAERLFAEEKRDDEQRAAWRFGQQLLPTPIDQTDGEAEMGMQAGNGALARCCPRPPLCWQRGSL